jgi:hypothetical protein
MGHKVSSADNGKARFKPRNPHKYIGDPNNIIIRSSWETKVFKFCDDNVNVLRWSSEEDAIPYLKPMHNGGLKPAFYYPDLYVEYMNVDGELIKEVFEVKPKKFTRQSRSRTDSVRMFENYQYIVNMAKFAAADNWCKAKGYKFTILSEDSIFRK